MDDRKKVSHGDIVNAFKEKIEEFQKRRFEAPRLLTLEEIEQAPDYALIYKEVRADWRKDALRSLQEDMVETSIAPVEKHGGTLYGRGMDTNICPEMFGGPEDECQVRYWLGRPTEEQREATPWE